MNSRAYARIFLHLVHRNLKHVVKQIPQRLIDGSIIVFMQTLAIGQFLPLMGMAPRYIPALYIGTITQIIFSVAYSLAFDYINDLHKKRFIDYQLTLPLPLFWLFGVFIVTFMLEIFLVSMPLIFLGAYLLGPLFPLANAHWGAALGMLSLNILFYVILLLYLAFSSEFTWFIDNAWARRLSPLFLLGCSFYTWKQLYTVNPGLSLLSGISPLTYAHEGLRAALLGSSAYIPLSICIPMMLFFCLIIAKLLVSAVKKRLDPVVGVTNE